MTLKDMIDEMSYKPTLLRYRLEKELVNVEPEWLKAVSEANTALNIANLADENTELYTDDEVDELYERYETLEQEAVNLEDKVEAIREAIEYLTAVDEKINNLIGYYE